MAKNALVIKGANFSANKVTTVTFGNDNPCTGLALDQSAITATELGTITLTATVTPSNTTDDLIWSSSDPTVATVNGGVVNIVGLGSTTITAKCGEHTATCTIDLPELTIEPYYMFAKYMSLSSYPNIYAIATSKRELTLADNSGLSTTRRLKNQSSSAALDCCPIVLPNNTAAIELSYGADMRAGTIYVGWLDTESYAYDAYPTIANLIELNSDNRSAYNAATTWTYSKPDGANSVVCCVVPVSVDFADTDTPEAIALAKGIILKAKPAST